MVSARWVNPRGCFISRTIWIHIGAVLKKRKKKIIIIHGSMSKSFSSFFLALVNCLRKFIEVRIKLVNGIKTAAILMEPNEFWLKSQHEFFLSYGGFFWLEEFEFYEPQKLWDHSNDQNFKIHEWKKKTFWDGFASSQDLSSNVSLDRFSKGIWKHGYSLLNLNSCKAHERCFQ